jgi:threonine aldolase
MKLISGTIANQIAIMAYAPPGEEVICSRFAPD